MVITSRRGIRRRVGITGPATALVACLLGAGPALGAPALRHLTVMTYNVAGLPLGMSSSRPSRNEARISALLNIADLALVQEDFGYHRELVSRADFPYISRKDRTRVFPNPLALGDGLARFSRLPFEDYRRVTWSRCYGTFGHGSDCLAPKGFAMARHEVAPGIWLDVYNLHADAAGKAPDEAARRTQVRQLARFIRENSAGHALLVMGDTNSRYTGAGDILPELLQRTGLRDVWVQLQRGGRLPPVGRKVAACREDGMRGGDCEVVDKILYRSSPALELVPLRYDVPARRFEDAKGRPLSDHDPVLAEFALRLHVQERAQETPPIHVAGEEPTAPPVR